MDIRELKDKHDAGASLRTLSRLSGIPTKTLHRRFNCVCPKCKYPLPTRDKGKLTPVRNSEGVLEHVGSCCAFLPLEKDIAQSRDWVLHHQNTSVWMDNAQASYGLCLPRGIHVEATE